MWGLGWEKKLEQEKKDSAYLKLMKKLSDDIMARKSDIGAKYDGSAKDK